MSNPQLTVKQFAALALGQANPPWQLTKLLNKFDQKFLDLKPTIANLSSRQAVCYVNVRAVATVATLFSGSSEDVHADMPGNWSNLWSSQVPIQKSDLEALEAVLTPIGASIVYLSPYYILPRNPSSSDPYIAAGDAYIPPWVIVGFAGSYGALASIPAQSFPFQPNDWSQNDWSTLAALKTGAVIIPAGASNTAFPMVTRLGVGGVPYDVPINEAPMGPMPKNMIVLTGGNKQ